jgi:phage tail sheath protein FI
MPEYLAPGVYVEETSFRSKSIEGVSTTTTGFVGPTLYGPIEDEPEILTSLADYERTYGKGNRLTFAPDGTALTSRDDPGDPSSWKPMTNYMWQAVRSFFDNGGSRLYVKRIYRGIPIGPEPANPDDPWERDDGLASTNLRGGGSTVIRVQARHPGAAGKRTVRLTLSRGRSVLSTVVDPITGNATTVARGLVDRDVVLLERSAGSPPSMERTFALASLRKREDGSEVWRLVGPGLPVSSPPGGPDEGVGIDELSPAGAKVAIVTLTVTDVIGDALGDGWKGLALDSSHARSGVQDSVFDRFAKDPARKADRLELPVIIRAEDGAGKASEPDGLKVLEALFAHAAATSGGSPGEPTLREQLETLNSSDPDRSIDVVLTRGNDGMRPAAQDYEGESDPEKPFKLGLKAFEDLEDISIVAAPGSTEGYRNGYRDQADTIIQSLIGHCEKMRYRIAVLDAGDGQSISDVRTMRATIDSKYAALYYPWVVVLDPITQRELPLPPSGFVTGIYARNDRMRAVYKAPANEVVTGALRFETMLNKSQQEVLNPEGVNCFRFFEGRGNRLWGARTVSSDPEWKYVNLRRYFAYLERSIDIGTQWAVFEPNGELLWGNIRRTIEDFLLNEFQMGALLGDKPEKAFFVKCDRSTMTQNDLDNGRLVCLIGVAPLRPAEFVIFRIGQWTADRKV